MDPYTNPQRAAGSPGRGRGAVLAVAALIVALVALSIAGAAYWRPEARSRETLALGGARPVRNGTPAAGESISSVLEIVAPSLAFLTIPELARSGSGVVVHESGFVVTNAHVVEGVDELLVALGDGEEYDAVVYGVDRSTDLAVVKVNADHPLQAAPLGDSDLLRVGEFVVALGAPFGLEASATSGIVSGLHRSGLGIARFEDFIVTDAPINRGNSGGPLVNLRGEVVGINTAIIADDADPHGMGTFAGVGFAIPVNVMRVVAQRLIGDGGVVRSDAPRARGNGGVSGGLSSRGRDRADVSLLAGDPLPHRGRAARRQADSAGQGSVAYVQAYNARGVSMERGSAFVIAVRGKQYLLTAAHVVDGARQVRAFFVAEGSRDYDDFEVTVLVVNEGLDLALLGLPEGTDLVPFRLVDGGEVAVGQLVTAVGTDLTAGKVVAVTRVGKVVEVGVRRRGVAAQGVLLAIDTGFQKGDSGGPLLDASGHLVGVVTGRDPPGPGARSYAVAVRSDIELMALLDGITASGRRPRTP